jgi:triosephosphate isomerase
MSKSLVAGNWKMHLTRAEATALATALDRALQDLTERVDVALFPPLTCLAEVVAAVKGGEITVGAQNVYPEDKGAFTGEVSPVQLLDAGVTRVLVGHSERRWVLGESDAFVNRKVKAALAHDMLPILCVGEQREEREAGRTAAVVEAQVRAGLAGVGPERATDLTVAYEPVWAIGTGLTATTAEAGEVHALIRRLLMGLLGSAGAAVRILYGGSVKPENARELMATPDIDGVLVGGASLSAESFTSIVRGA